MDNITTSTLSISLFVLIILSAFFSSSETSMMSLNRYRLKNLVKKKNRGAILTQKLLDKPERLIGLILIGNNFVNLLAASIATVICVRFWGDLGYLISTVSLTFIVLIFAEVTPKTLAALYPERVAFSAAYLLTLLSKLFFILVIGLNFITSGLLRLIGVNLDDRRDIAINADELKIVVNEAGQLISKRYQDMLLSVLSLEEVTVEDIMIPRNEILGVDLAQPIDKVINQMKNSVHTRLPVYHDEIDNIKGFLHARQIIKLLAHNEDELTCEIITSVMNDVYFIPEGTPLNIQLLNFQRKKLRIGVVVDEYGDIQGLVTLEDILEEIVGEFTTDFTDVNKQIQKASDGSIILDGSTTAREINRLLEWHLPTDGPKTLNGLILEYIEAIPQSGTGLRLAGYPMEILQIKSNMVKSVRVWPELFVDPNKD